MPLALRDGEGFAAVYQRALAFITAAAPHSRQRFNQLPTQQVVQALGIRAMPISFAQTNLRDAALALADCATSPLFEANHDMASASLSWNMRIGPTAMPCSSGCVFVRTCLTKMTCATARNISCV
ncbi:hypothetical protein IC615_22000 [Serratia ureilytica]